MLRVITVTICLILFALACSEGEDRPPTPTPTSGAMLAAIDGESMESTYAKRADYLLGKIARWCPGDLSAERVGDMALTARNMLRDDYGVEKDVLEVLEDVADGTTGTGPAVLSCAEVFALYVTVKGQ